MQFFLQVHTLVLEHPHVSVSIISFSLLSINVWDCSNSLSGTRHFAWVVAIFSVFRQIGVFSKIIFGFRKIQLPHMQPKCGSNHFYKDTMKMKICRTVVHTQGSEPNSFNVNTDWERLHRFILNHNITQFPPVRRLFSFSLSWQKARNWIERWIG